MKGFIYSLGLCILFFNASPIAASETTKNALKYQGIQSSPHIKTANQQTKFQKIVKTKAAIAPPPASFILSGAVAGRNAKKAWNASIHWMQRGANAYQIRLYGPLGSGNILISRKGNTVQIRDGKTISNASNADVLLREKTGIVLPVQSLYYWVRGIPAPGKIQQVKKDHFGHLISLKQQGYTIQYLGYTQALNHTLPTHIKLNGRTVSVNLIIKQWST